jgi:hypothetical protein
VSELDPRVSKVVSAHSLIVRRTTISKQTRAARTTTVMRAAGRDANEAEAVPAIQAPPSPPANSRAPTKSAWWKALGRCWRWKWLARKREQPTLGCFEVSSSWAFMRCVWWSQMTTRGSRHNHLVSRSIHPLHAREGVLRLREKRVGLTDRGFDGDDHRLAFALCAWTGAF